MSSTRLGIPKGTRDFGPQIMAKRQHILQHIQAVFRKFGYQPLETPSMENLSVLTGKYGDEGDQLLYKILDSGDYLKKTSVDDYKAGYQQMLPKIATKGLRYDLTVPFARYVTMHRHEIAFPFKRYQMQPVWRADRPQKGRYREFFQCDADVVGTGSLLCEAELIALIHEVFNRLGIEDFTIRINHRELLKAMTNAIEAPGREVELATALDKVHKVGLGKVEIELRQKGFTAHSIDLLTPIIGWRGDWTKHRNAVLEWMESSSDRKGVNDLDKIFDYLDKMSLPARRSGGKANVAFDASLARGLTYYTGTIFEVVVNNADMGSVGGGGRYDDLTGIFGLPDVSGVGISFGVDRIYDVMEQLSLFPEKDPRGLGAKVLLVSLDDESEGEALDLLCKLRSNEIASELYPDRGKLKKPLNYANKKGIPTVVLIGPEEIASKKFTVKHMAKGTQKQLTRKQLLVELLTDSAH